jgi:hypothetical protein
LRLELKRRSAEARKATGCGKTQLATLKFELAGPLKPLCRLKLELGRQPTDTSRFVGSGCRGQIEPTCRLSASQLRTELTRKSARRAAEDALVKALFGRGAARPIEVRVYQTHQCPLRLDKAGA